VFLRKLEDIYQVDKYKQHLRRSGSSRLRKKQGNLKEMVEEWTKKILSGDLESMASANRGRRERQPPSLYGGDRVVMVDQLWLWVIRADKGNCHTIVTSFPNCVGNGIDIDSQIDDSELINDVSDLVRLILTRCVQEPQMEDLSPGLYAKLSEDVLGGTKLIEAFQGTVGLLVSVFSGPVSR
jgi:hypothetical protein